jgi:hypothetical protein
MIPERLNRGTISAAPGFGFLGRDLAWESGAASVVEAQPA